MALKHIYKHGNGWKVQVHKEYHGWFATLAEAEATMKSMVRKTKSLAVHRTIGKARGSRADIKKRFRVLEQMFKVGC